jgi:O-antigen ligase
MKRFSAAIILLTIVAGTLVLWIRARWTTTIPEVSLCALAAAWCLLFITRRNRARTSFALIPVAGVIVWAGFQLLIGSTIYAWQTRMAILYWSANFAALFTGLQSFSDTLLRARFLRALLVFGFVICIFSTLQGMTTDARIFWLFQSDYKGFYIFGPFPYHNHYAAFIELLLPIALYNALTDRAGRFFYVLVAATMYASVIAAASRAGFALTTAEIIVVPAVTMRRWKISRKPLLGAGAVLAGMVLLLAVSAGPGLLIGRFGLSDPVRREFDLSSVAMAKDHLLLGVGLGNWPVAYPGYARFDNGHYANQAHNDWAQWTVEGGIPLAALMLCLACWAIPRAVRSGWGAGIAAILIHCLIDYPISRSAIAVIFFVLVAAVHYPVDIWVPEE